LGSSEKFTDDKKALVAAAEQALYASKIISYPQGLSLLRMASLEYNWNIDLSLIEHVWRAGCIIRASLLIDIPMPIVEILINPICCWMTC